MARAAGRLAGRWLPVAKSAANAARSEATHRSEKLANHLGERWVPTARQSGRFVKHVLPAVAKPIHSLWHQLLGFIFLAFAGLCAWKVWRNEEAIAPPIIAIAIVFIIVMAAYGISSIRKSQRISRS
jgi:membrane protein DedA with SNARE-associated domain